MRRTPFITLQVAWDKGFRFVFVESHLTMAIPRPVNKGCSPSHPCASIVSLINRRRMQD